MSKLYKLAWVLSIAALIIGLLLTSKEVTTYSTDEYWVAKNYHHVYEQYSGEIVNYIEDDETCKIKNGQIIVTRNKTGRLGSALGGLLAFTAGCWIAGLIICAFPHKSDERDHNHIENEDEDDD